MQQQQAAAGSSKETTNQSIAIDEGWMRVVQMQGGSRQAGRQAGRHSSCSSMVMMS